MTFNTSGTPDFTNGRTVVREIFGGLQVLTASPCETVVWIESALQFSARRFVVSHLHWDGSDADVLSASQWTAAVEQCDGFGKMTWSEIEANGFDWSHVRDSQPETFVTVARWIASQKWARTFDEMVQDRVDFWTSPDCERDFDPVRLLDW